jgi:hypothetical protein
MAQKPCGQHTELASNDAVRITRCTCGTVHVTLQANGVTVRLTGEQLRALGKGIEGALSKVDQPNAVGSSCVN